MATGELMATQDLFRYIGITVVMLAILNRIVNRFRGKAIEPSLGKAVVVTGCDSGFGKAAALRLAEDGYVVFACCLDAATASKSTFSQKVSSKFHVVQMNVTDAKEIEAAVAYVRNWLDSNEVYRLTALVSNAGVAFLGYTELVSMESIERTINVNLVGLTRVVKAFLPLLRRNEKRDSRIVAVTSMASRMPGPKMASYCASKAASLAFVDSLRFEIDRLGISISTVMPDFYATEMTVNLDRLFESADRMLDQTNPAVLQEYGGRELIARKSRDHFANIAKMAKPDISPVINDIAHAVGSRRPERRYYPIGVPTRVLLCIYSVCPSLAEFLLKTLDK